MAKKSEQNCKEKTPTAKDSFLPRNVDDPLAPAAANEHVYGKSRVCSTDTRGYPTPRNRNPLEIVLDSSEGFIPLWAKGVNLRWRFNEPSMSYFQNPDAAKRAIRKLFGEALLMWGESAPVSFSERDDAWDFEIVMRNSDNCSINGCTLASAFFPEPGRNELVIYPKMLSQSYEEMVETIVHEVGHIFGLRHFFADVSETAWPSVVFGSHKPFSIMNYGHLSELTEDDKSDLATLYSKVWNGELKEINGTKIVQVLPFHRLSS